VEQHARMGEFATNGIEALAVVIIVVSVAFLFRVFAVREHWPQMVPLVVPGAGPRVNKRPIKKAG